MTRPWPSLVALGTPRETQELRAKSAWPLADPVPRRLVRFAELCVRITGWLGSEAHTPGEGRVCFSTEMGPLLRIERMPF
jgi:hypothetical protein